jgi:zinc/manganese transport system ATP-binding protein
VTQFRQAAMLTNVITSHIDDTLDFADLRLMTNACLTFRDLTLGYNSHAAIHHLNGVVRKGSLTAVVGANGSGKSTLMKGIVGVLKPMEGAVIRMPGVRVAYLPQQSELDRSFPARVVDLVSLGLWPKRGMLGRYTSEDRESVSKALMAVGLGGFEKRPIDEPFNAVDAKTVGDLIQLIKRWHGEERTIMVVVHDLELVRQNFPETLLLARQPVAWGDTKETLRPENLLKARRFHEAWEENAPWCEPDDHDHGHGHDHTHAHDHLHDHHHGSGPRAA